MSRPTITVELGGNTQTFRPQLREFSSGKRGYQVIAKFEDPDTGAPFQGNLMLVGIKSEPGAENAELFEQDEDEDS